MRRYDSYKDSGVKWLGEIPRHWDCVKLKYYVSSTRKKVDDVPIKYVGLENIESFTGRWIETDSEYDKEQAIECNPNDVLFGKLRPYLAKAMIVKDRVACSSEFIVFTKVPNPKYFQYVLLSKIFINIVDASTYGAKMPRADIGYVLNLPFAFPKANEQNMIANYLDFVTSKIDAAIAQQQKMIDLLNERKQIIINNAVTKGLDPNVPMKDSGVEWIGEIPKHWEVVRIKYLLKESKERSETGNEEPLSMSQLYGLIPTKQMDVIPNMASSFVGAKIVKEGDLVFNKLKAHLGVFNVSRYEGLVSPDYAVYTSTGRAKLQFLEYIFKTPKCIHEFVKLITGVGAGLSRLYTSDLYSIYCALPSLEEQSAICKFIEDKTAKIIEAIVNCQNQISLLQERKQIVINDVVTGKVKVV